MCSAFGLCIAREEAKSTDPSGQLQEPGSTITQSDVHHSGRYVNCEAFEAVENLTQLQSAHLREDEL